MLLVEVRTLYIATSISNYFKGYTGTGRQQGNLTPRTMNSLSAIAGHEGEEEDWEREMRDLRGDDEVSHFRDRRCGPRKAISV